MRTYTKYEVRVPGEHHEDVESTHTSEEDATDAARKLRSRRTEKQIGTGWSLPIRVVKVDETEIMELR